MATPKETEAVADVLRNNDGGGRGTRARVIAKEAKVPRDTARDVLRTMQDEGRAASHDQRWSGTDAL